ncbi:hypothetical protein NKG05_25330 [Oerskovia sp. M15]
MSRVVTVPTLARSAVLIVAGLSGLGLAQVALVLGLGLEMNSAGYANGYSASSGASTLVVLSGLLALSGCATLMVGLFRAADNVDRYLTFRVAVTPRRIGQRGTSSAFPEVGAPDHGYVSSQVR